MTWLTGWTRRKLITYAGAASAGTAPRTLVGVIGLDITLNEIQANLESRAFSAGSYAFLPMNQHHYYWVEDDSVFQVHAVGPFGIAYAHPEERVHLEALLAEHSADASGAAAKWRSLAAGRFPALAAAAERHLAGE